MMEDESGGDEKIIAVPATKLTRRYEKVTNYTDLPGITLEQIDAGLGFMRRLAAELGEAGPES